MDIGTNGYFCLFFPLGTNGPRFSHIKSFLFQADNEHVSDSPEIGTRLYFQPDYSYGCLMKKWSL